MSIEKDGMKLHYQLVTFDDAAKKLREWTESWSTLSPHMRRALTIATALNKDTHEVEIQYVGLSSEGEADHKRITQMIEKVNESLGRVRLAMMAGMVEFVRRCLDEMGGDDLQAIAHALRQWPLMLETSVREIMFQVEPERDYWREATVRVLMVMPLSIMRHATDLDLMVRGIVAASELRRELKETTGLKSRDG